MPLKRYCSLPARASRLLLAGVCALLVAAGTARAQQQTLLVVYNQDEVADDQRMLELLEDSLGYALKLVDDNVVTRADTAGTVGIYISESVPSGNVLDKFKGVGLPVINAEAFTWDDHKWLANDPAGGDVDHGYTNSQTIRVAGSHPILGGLSEMEVNVSMAPLGTDPPQQVGWARPVASAEVLATLPGFPDRAAIFLFEPGDQLRDGTTVKARSVGYYTHRRGSDRLTRIGERLFLNTVAWAMSRPDDIEAIAPPTMLVVYNEGEVNRDVRMLELLEDSLGYNLKLVDDEVVTRADTADADAVFISESVPSGNVLDKFKGIFLPVINIEAFTWDDHKWLLNDPAGGDVDHGFTNSDSMVVADSDHPILGGLDSGLVVLYGAPTNPAEPNQVGWGIPVGSAEVLATLPGFPDRATLFVFEQGDTLKDGTRSLARAANFYAHRRGSDSFNDLSEKLFMNTVLWTTMRTGEIRSIGDTGTDVEPGGELPQTFAIEGVYPNPFNPATTVALQVRETGDYRLRVYDLQGRLVRQQTIGIRAPGAAGVSLDLADQASGLYLIQLVHLRTGETATARAMLVK